MYVVSNLAGRQRVDKEHSVCDTSSSPKLLCFATYLRAFSFTDSAPARFGQILHRTFLEEAKESTRKKRQPTQDRNRAVVQDLYDTDMGLNATSHSLSE